MRNFHLAILALSLLPLFGCAQSENSKLRQNALNANQNLDSIEARNYKWRQNVAENPNTILWCTFSFVNPSSPLITIPIQGKLTSSGKLPFLTDALQPGPDGMYGRSAEYRYGFGVAGKNEYYELTGVASLCTTVPKVWQREKTIIGADVDLVLQKASSLAEKLLREGKPQEANELLQKTLSSKSK